jgi:pilus assembly protein CpaB
MRLRSLILFVVALALAGGTTMIARGWLAQQAAKAEASVVVPKVAPAKSVLVARRALPRGQILKVQDFAWQVWPSGALDPSYILSGRRPITAFTGWVAREPIAAGDPITEAKIVAPGNRGFLAAVLRPGMRAVSVPITVTSGISGFVFPGDRVDLLITYPVRLKNGEGNPVQHKAAETVLRDVRVIAIDQKLTGKDGEAVVAHTATLEVTPKQSEIIAVASEMGQLSLSLRSLVDPNGHRLADSTAGKRKVTYTLDSEVSPLISNPLSKKGDSADGMVTILRGGQQSAQPVGSQPASRGL